MENNSSLAKALQALKKAGRFRVRFQSDPKACDFASNDYLGLAEKKSQLKKAYRTLLKYPYFAPKSSQLVGGYHPIHEAFEKRLCTLNGFEAGLVVGSGFLANLAMIEALPRKGDLLLMDEDYHASGIVAAKLCEATVKFFPHNDAKAAEATLLGTPHKNVYMAIEGIYSMGGDMASRDLFELAERHNIMLMVDEAHSSGVLGENLLGIFDHYKITPKSNHIKMGTLGKAYGSYGAYILGNPEVISFLENRAKSVIYATAPSLFDIALADHNLQYLHKHRKKLRRAIDANRQAAREILGLDTPSLILPIPVKDSQTAIYLRDTLRGEGFEVGAIRPPTVKTPILRVILRLGDPKALKRLLSLIKNIS